MSEIRKWPRSTRTFLDSHSFGVAVVAALLVVAAGVGFTAWHWDWLHGDSAGATASTTLRNMGLLIAGGLAIVFAAWRGWVAERQSATARRQAETAQEQADTAHQGLLHDRYQRGAEMLGHEILSVRLAGIYSLERLAKDDPKQYHIQVIQSFCSFVTNPPNNSEQIELPSGQAANAEQATRQDVRAAIYALGNRSEVGKSLEEEAEIRLDLRSARLVGCDLSQMDFSNSLLGGADLTSANLVNCHLNRADLRRTIFTNGKLEGTNFSQAILYKTNLSRTTCVDANFANTVISQSNLSRGTFTKASFNGTMFIDTVLTNASLKDADLSWAYFSTDENELSSFSRKIGLTQAQLDEAQWNSWSPPNLNGLFDAETLEPLVVNADFIYDESSSKEAHEDAE